MYIEYKETNYACKSTIIAFINMNEQFYQFSY